MLELVCISLCDQFLEHVETRSNYSLATIRLANGQIWAKNALSSHRFTDFSVQELILTKRKSNKSKLLLYL